MTEVQGGQGPQHIHEQLVDRLPERSLSTEGNCVEPSGTQLLKAALDLSSLAAVEMKLRYAAEVAWICKAWGRDGSAP
jgi:hypothetical protein